LGDRDRYGLALTLGGGEVRLIELTAAYAGLANGGHRVTANPILAVLDGDASRTEVDDQARWRDVITVGARPAVSAQVAWLVTDILADDRARLPAFGEHSALDIGRPAGAKTGTTTDFRDNWTVGYTPDLAVGVWLGNADNTPMAHISGVTGAGPIWHELMEEAHRAWPVRTFRRPGELTQVEVCATSGLLPTEWCRRRAREWFVAGTEPQQPDTTYRAMTVDSATGRAWADGCRGPRVQRVFRMLPPDAAEWGRASGMPTPPETTCAGGPVVAEPAAAEEARPGGLGTSSRTRAGSADARAGAQSSRTGSTAGDGAAGLVIARPAVNATFALSPQLPRDFQRIELEAHPAAVATPLQTVTLMVDDVALATLQRPPYRASWQLVPGTHTVRAVGVDRQGRTVGSAPTRFRVVSDDGGHVP